MANFSIAVAITLQNEGGYVDNPKDSAGATKYGITQEDMPGVNIADITVNQAQEYYSENYWKPLYGQIADQEIASKTFDMGVLFGVRTAVHMLQQAIGVEPTDGVFGVDTLDHLNQTDPTTALNAFKRELIDYVYSIVTNKPSQRVFLKGWINRILS